MPQAAASAAYPRDREADVVLRDGSTVRVRPVRADDAVAVHDFLEGLSPESIAFRFFGAADLDWATRFFLDVDYAGSFALLAESGNPRRVIAHAAYARIDDERAEVAFVVSDQWQGHGIATILLAHLAGVAHSRGISTFTAQVLPANHRMVDVFRESGFPVTARSTRDAIEVELPTSLTPEALERFEERERIAAVAAVRSFLEPHSVAVIGASRRRGTVGGEILHNLVQGGFTGNLYAVNPYASTVQGLPAYPSVADLPGPAELAVIVVPAERVLAAARDCSTAGVRALLVVSAGFGESGPEGAERQRQLVEHCRETGMRIVGPNCFGALNTAEPVKLNATFASTQPHPGHIGLLSQSGGVGIAIMTAAARRGIGLSSFVSVGNKADISGNDLLHFWEQDAGTDVALLYLESVGNPRKFARIAPRVARKKPVLAVKSGRSSAGARATSSHTGAMLSASDVTVGALFEQAGVIRADTLPELLDVAELLATQPVPKGDRLVIVTNGGGPGILSADAALAAGISVPELDEGVRDALAARLPPTSSVANPVDMIATATAEDYGRTLSTLIAAGAADAILALYVPALGTDAGAVAQAIRETVEDAPDPPAVAAVFMTDDGPPPELISRRLRIPHFDYPEEAARALAHAARYGRWLARDPGLEAQLGDLRGDEARAIISRALADGESWLSPQRVVGLLDCYGLPLVDTQLVSDASAAAELAGRWRAPIALKAVAPELIHKSDAGGVRLNLTGRRAVLKAAEEMERSVAAAGHELEGLLVQPMAVGGTELIIGVVNDTNFGPVIACGAGGTAAELVRDVAVRITPLRDRDAAEMLRSLRSFPLLNGYRGTPPCDLDALEDILLRVSAMVETHPEIAELDCNPVLAGPQGAQILDARVRVHAAAPAAPIPSLRA